MIEAICSQPYSFFVVTDLDPGNGMTLKDLFLSGETYVHERQVTTMLDKGSIIYSRIIDMRENFEKRVGTIDRELLLENDIELRTIYYDTREALYNPVPPRLHNTDGDPLQLTKIHYSLNCVSSEAMDALATLALQRVAAALQSGCVIAAARAGIGLNRYFGADVGRLFTPTIVGEGSETSVDRSGNGIHWKKQLERSAG